MTKTLKIALWNVNGVHRRETELEGFLSGEKVDVCFLTETHLKEDSKFKITGYEFYHTPHPSNKARAGSGVLIRDTIGRTLKFLKRDYRFQLTVVNISDFGLNVGSVYCPPRENLKVKDYEEFLILCGERFIIGGDFNAKNKDAWGSNMTNTKGRELGKAIDNLACVVESTRKPTHRPSVPYHKSDVLDFFITKGVSSNSIIDEHGYLTTDHQLITLEYFEEV